jgi:hypothetical protein
MAEQGLNRINKTEEKETGNMKRDGYFRFAQLALLALMLSLSAGAARAQTTSFTYQGSLNDGGNPANGTYDLQFKLFDALSGGAQQGSTIVRDDVQVTGGVFTVTLDFGAPAFPGANRFLEIAVRPGASTGAFTTLSPRQQITSTPYAIKSLGAASADGLSNACVNCVTSGQIGSLPTGSGAYIQNATSQQAGANFNISGNGTAGGTLSADTVNATTQYNFGGSRVLSAAGVQNLFAGLNAGASNTTGASNAFFGFNAGVGNTTGANNSFFGRNAGAATTTGGLNSFFGFNAGGLNTAGSNNSFFGLSAGSGNTNGGSNSFFGIGAGGANTTGSNNTAIGASANVATGALSFATAIGAGAVVSTSNTVALGRNLDTVSVPGSLAVAGTQTANVVSAMTQFNIGVNRVLSVAGTDNLFAGVGAGAVNTGGGNSFFGASAGSANTTACCNSFFGVNAGASNSLGSTNSFLGYNAGRGNTTGGSNSFFGFGAGEANTTASFNSFFGRGAGAANTTGHSNSFFGAIAGEDNTTGNSNSFFGVRSGASNTIGPNNAFFGSDAGQANTTGGGNSFFGSNTGRANSTGDSNSFFGASAGLFNTTGSDNSFFGGYAGQVNTTGSRNAFFGNFAGFANTTGCCNSFFGDDAGRANTMGVNNAFFGIGAGLSNTTASNNAFFGDNAGQANTTGNGNAFFGSGAGLSNTTGAFNTLIGAGASATGNPSFATAIGAGASVSTSNTVVLGRSLGEDTVRIPGKLVLGALGGAGSTTLCRNIAGEISSCSSSLRYKDQIFSFRSGLELVGRLRPVTFNWKNTGERDLGLIAEEVAAIEPLLVTRNEKGEIEGVKYDQLNVVLINALKQQQEQIKQQQAEIEQLKQLVCADRPQAAVCKPGKQTR